MTAPAMARRWRRPGGASVMPATVRQYVLSLRGHAPLPALLVAGLVFHAAVAPHLAVGGLAPDVLLVMVAVVAALRRERAGAAFGFAAGLGADLFLTSPLGTSALAYTLLGHMLGRSSGPWASTAAPTAPRQALSLAFLGVASGRVAAAMVATALGGLPFPDTAGLLRITGVAALSAPLGPAAVSVVRRLAGGSGGRW